MEFIYKAMVIGSLGLYGAAGLFGWEFGATERAQIPSSVRSSPGGYRSAHFWHSGYLGGK